MPGGDRTGPTGAGPGSGRRGGRGQSQGQGQGRMDGPFAAGAGGSCVCPKCGETIAHIVGQPCNQINCPKCSTKMTRN